ncbi:MAG: hypothetical protein ABI579_08470, partial [Candidatus Sumerlaeota bacterium]
MTRRASSNKAVKYLLFLCGIVIVLALLTYGWMVKKPTGFDRLPTETKRDVQRIATQQHELKKQLVAPVTPASSPTKPKSAATKRRNYYELAQLWGAQPIWHHAMLSGEVAEYTRPENVFHAIRQHSPSSIRYRNFAGQIATEDGLRATLADFTEEFWNVDSDTPSPSNELKLGSPWFAGSAIVAPALRGDPGLANRRAQNYLIAAAQEHDDYDIMQWGCIGFITALESIDMLTTATLAQAIDLPGQSILSPDEYEDLRRVFIRKRIELAKAVAAAAVPSNNARTYFLEGIPDRLIRGAVLPVFNSELEKYGVAFANRDYATAQEGLSSLESRLQVLNLSDNVLHGGERGGIENDIDGNIQDYTEFQQPSIRGFTSDHAHTGRRRWNDPYYRAQFAFAAAAFHQREHRWPEHSSELIPNFLPKNFESITESEWYVFKSEEFDLVMQSPPDLSAPLVLFQKQNSRFPTSPAELAAFMHATDEELFRPLFLRIPASPILMQVRRYPVCERDGLFFFDDMGRSAEGETDPQYAGM